MAEKKKTKTPLTRAAKKIKTPEVTAIAEALTSGVFFRCYWHVTIMFCEYQAHSLLRVHVFLSFGHIVAHNKEVLNSTSRPQRL